MHLRHGLCLGLDDFEDLAKVSDRGPKEADAICEGNFLVHKRNFELAGNSTISLSRDMANQ
jgi:hypothetical protein